MTGKRLSLAVDWLTNTEVYDTRGKSGLEGGVAAFYDAKKREHSFLYTEITGYFISFLSLLHRYSRNKEIKRKLIKSAEWITKTMRYEGSDPYAQGAISWQYDLRQGKATKAYSFDCAMCSKALFDAYIVSGNKRFLAQAEKTLQWIIDVMMNEDGSVKPAYDWGEKRFTYDKSKWYEVPGSLHIKMAIPLLQASELLNKNNYAKSAEKIGKWGLGLQENTGGFEVNRHLKYVNAHAHCYALEGLAYLHSYTGNDKFLEAFRKGILWLLNSQNRDGSIREWSRNKRLVMNKKTSYVAAQASRLFLIAYTLFRDETFLSASRKALNFALSMQCMDKGDANAFGGFFEGCDLLGPFKFKSKIINTWATIFTSHALLMHKQYTTDAEAMPRELF